MSVCLPYFQISVTNMFQCIKDSKRQGSNEKPVVKPKKKKKQLDDLTTLSPFSLNKKCIVFGMLDPDFKLEGREFCIG